MPDRGEDLGVDLYELWRAGQDNLPTVSREYAVATAYVADASDGLAAALWRPTRFHRGGAHGPAYAPWVELRDELQRILADTAVNLELVGDALCLAATRYARTDAAAAEELKRRRHDDGDPVPPSVPSPQYPR